MYDMKNLVKEINRIIGQEGAIEKIDDQKSVGNYCRKNGNIFFQLDNKYSLFFSEGQLTDRDVQFISLLLTKTIKSEIESSDIILEHILEGKDMSKQELISAGFSPNEPYLPIVLKVNKPDAWKDLFYSYFTKQVGMVLKDGYYHILVPTRDLGMDEITCTDLEDLGNGYVNLLLEEGIDSCLIAFAEPISTYLDWKSAWDKAKNAIIVGHQFYPETPIFFSWKLSLETLLTSLSFQETTQYLEATLGSKALEELDPELFKIVSVLLEVNFNISETARRLFIHRNTLLYRMDRVREETGKDLRLAKDTIEIYIALLLQNKIAQKR